MRKINLTKQKFGRLTALEEAGRDKWGNVLWKCMCECGKTTIVYCGSLKNGNTKSCGCLTRGRHPTHRMGQTQVYKTWNAMLQRCTNPNNPAFKNYGGRGIKVCKEWLNSFGVFFKDMGEKPQGLSIERKDNNKDYFPENCKWATRTEQNRNQRIKKNNKTGVTGVWWDRNRQIYQVRITTNHKRIHIGSFAGLEDATTARKQAESKYWKTI